jgi:pimeloyl-ACP methyl ester carboxylesterase
VRIPSFIVSVAVISMVSCACESNTNLSELNGTLKVNPPDTMQVNPIPQPLLLADSTFTIDFNSTPIEVIIKMPVVAFKGTIIVLPGWNFPNTGWCDSTELCSTALAKGYALVLPQMGKSIYCEKTYPETRKGWLQYPTRSWMKTTMIPSLQENFNLLIAEQPNFVLGLSTGARGAALLALDLPEIFKGCAALSGDFDQTPFPSDNLYIGYYGQMKQFPERWKKDDNVITHIDSMNVPMYIGHGAKDKVVDLKHSELLVNALKLAGKPHEFHVDPNAGHTYTYWNSEVKNMLGFFEKQDRSL